MLLLRKLVLQRHFISLFLSVGYRNGIGSHVLRNTFRLAPTTVACVVHSGAQIIALCFSAQTHRLCFASNTDLIVPKAKHLCPLAPGVRKRLFLLPLPAPKKSTRACGRCGAGAPQRPHALDSSGVEGLRLPLFFLPPYPQDSAQEREPYAGKGHSDFGWGLIGGLKETCSGILLCTWIANAAAGHAQVV